MKQPVYFLLLFPLLIWSQTNFDKAEKLFKEEKYNQAQPLFESFLKTNPSDLRTIEYLGDISGYYKSWDKAIVYYKRLKMLKPSEADYHYKYGGALGMKAKEVNKFKALGMIGEVRECFEKAIDLNPKHIDARWALIELNLQLPAIVGGSESKAIKYSNELLKLSPIDGYLSRGYIEEYFKRYKTSEQQYRKAIAVSGSKTSYQKLANLYKNKMNDPEKANAVLEEYRKKELSVSR
jgi:tetratricopeptide (TPR) repeat protein